MKYEKLRRLYADNFSLGYLNTDINNKFALISLTCKLKKLLSSKKPDVTYYMVLKKIAGESISEDFIKALSIICEDFAYGCDNFPDFGLKDKEIPSKIKHILDSYMPF